MNGRFVQGVDRKPEFISCHVAPVEACWAESVYVLNGSHRSHGFGFLLRIKVKSEHGFMTGALRVLEFFPTRSLHATRRTDFPCSWRICQRARTRSASPHVTVIFSVKTKRGNVNPGAFGKRGIREIRGSV